MAFHLSTIQATLADEVPRGPACLLHAELAGKACEDGGWANRPTWHDIATGLRPPEPPDPMDTPLSLGEWAHGWQFHASDALKKSTQERFRRTLPADHFRANAISRGKSRLQS
eukprot:4688369-Pyramimonas_sp.AAC.1